MITMLETKAAMKR